jgi:hypothetical protein
MTKLGKITIILNYYYYSKWYLLFCLVLYFVYVCILSFTRAHIVIGLWAVELVHK